MNEFDGLGEAALTFEPTPAGICDTTRAVLSRLAGASPNDGHAERVASSLADGVARVLLDWMASGRTAEIDALIDALPKTIAAASPHRWVLHDLPVDAGLAARLLGYLRLAATYRTSRNTLQERGVVLGGRYERWKEVLRFIYEAGRSIKAGELLHRGIFEADRETSAFHALNGLVRYGLVERIKYGPDVWFDLSWRGRRLCEELFGSKSPSPVPLVPDTRGFRASAVERTLGASGLGTTARVQAILAGPHAAGPGAGGYAAAAGAPGASAGPATEPGDARERPRRLRPYGVSSSSGRISS